MFFEEMNLFELVALVKLCVFQAGASHSKELWLKNDFEISILTLPSWLPYLPDGLVLLCHCAVTQRDSDLRFTPKHSEARGSS